VGCGAFGVEQVLVGLNRVGIVGLLDALKEVAASGLDDREAVVDRLIEILATENFFTDPRDADLRTALWREYLRSRGHDFREFLSEIRVTVRGEPGEKRDRFVAAVETVLAGFELKPVVAFSPGDPSDPGPQLVIHDEIVVRGIESRRSIEAAIRRSVSGW